MCLGTSRTRWRAFTFTASECSFPFGACVWKAWGFFFSIGIGTGNDNTWPFAVLVIVAEGRAGTMR